MDLYLNWRFLESAQIFIKGSNTILSFLCFCFLGLNLWHMEVPRLGVKLDQQLLTYAIATSDLSWILNPLSEARD